MAFKAPLIAAKPAVSGKGVRADPAVIKVNDPSRYEIVGMLEGRKALNHPLVGRLILEHTTFHVSNAPNLQLILQLPIKEETEQKL
jgi:hypothetical protein